MARIEARKNKQGEIISYRIRVYRGYDDEGHKLKPYETAWKVPEGWTEKRIQKELQKVAADFENRCQQGEVCSEQDMKLSKFCEMYLDLVKNSLAPRTLEAYTDYINKLIIPSLGHMKLSEIKPVHVQRFVQMIAETPKPNGKMPAASTVQRKLVCLQSIMRQAVKLGIIPNSPADSKKLTLPKVVQPAVEIFSKQEATAIVDALQNEPLQFQVCIQLAIISGARLGELVALKFADADCENHKVLFQRSAYKLRGKPTATKPPKDYDVRIVSVTPEISALIQLLKEEKQQKAEELGTAWHDEDWMFTQWDGTVMHNQTPSKQFRRFLKRNGFKVRKFHCLRHTSATLLLYSGVNLQQVKSRLGHSNLATTQRYLHAIKDADTEAANALQAMLISQQKKPDEASGDENQKAE